MIEGGATVAAAALDALEFEAVIEAIAKHSTCDPGRAAITRIQPQLGDRAIAAAEQALVEDVAGFFRAGGDFGFGGAIDVPPLLESAEKGAALSAKGLRQIAQTERSLRAAAGSLRDDRRPAGPLRALAAQRAPTDDIITVVERAVDEEFLVSDSASSELASIRRQQRSLHEQVRERCRSIIHNAELAKMLSEPIVTVRSGRYVVPVRSEFAGQFPGVAHDQSASGATVFIEPLASVEANNRLRALEAAEEREIARILADLSARVAGLSSELRANAGLLSALDSAGARARWAIDHDAGKPDLSQAAVIRIVRGRHPLLRHEAVPLDFDVGESFDAVVISGPNMGGKTVVLKTVGLFCLLAYAGIPLPAAAGTTIGGFRSIACIIGDEQSIAQDLSSFSAHLRALKAATGSAGRRSLVLVDEIGSGTEPSAGAALAQSCIEAMILAGAKVVVTTHFTQLKTFAAAHDRVRNASMLFDPQSHAPSYIFAMGIPGQSLAFALARSLGLDARIISRAETLVGIDAQNLERTFEKLALERDQLKKMQTQLEEQNARGQRLEQSMRQRVTALEQEKEAFERRASDQLRQAIDGVRKQLFERAQERSDVVKRQAAKPLPDSERLLAQTLGEMRRSLGLETAGPGAPPGRPLRPGDEVYVRSFDATGVVSEVYDNTLLVAIGNLKTLVSTSDVNIRAPGPLGASPQTSSQQRTSLERTFRSVPSPSTDAATTSVDVRGMRVDEAWPLIDKALDNAALAGLSELRVIHGKGTGRLMHGIREFLESHPQVESLSSAPDREGGSGVTVVKLV